MANSNTPFHPIIYVRGYAMTSREIDETTADPFCGFNLGSTVYRAVADETKAPRKFVFESPILRLATDFDYRDVYEDGYDILDTNWSKDGTRRLPYRSVIIHRYYDEASSILGSGRRPSIDVFAKGLSNLIARVRDLACENPANNVTREDFRCYLVAHSMGGLVCRAFLQGRNNDPAETVGCVDKFFTYATPHNGIDLSPGGNSGPGGFNTPSWLSAADLDNFNRPKMAKYLDLAEAFAASKRVDWIPEERFPGERVFCLVGTNRLDYETAMGLSRTFVGHGSDGLVRIANATLTSLKADGSCGEPCAKGFVYRSHSGFFGIVNSEEGYQNLSRFLFGDLRVDVWLDITRIDLPAAVAAAVAEKKKISALYQIEMTAAPRGKPWYLSRRKSDEDSVACISHEEWTADPVGNGRKYLATVFLANSARVRQDRDSLSYSLTLGVRVPDYEIDKRLWWDTHYEGGFLFRDAVVLEITAPTAGDGQWSVSYAWQEGGVKVPNLPINVAALATGKIEIPLELPDGRAPGVPGIEGKLRFVVSAWNSDRRQKG